MHSGDSHTQFSTYIHIPSVGFLFIAFRNIHSYIIHGIGFITANCAFPRIQNLNSYTAI